MFWSHSKRQQGKVELPSDSDDESSSSVPTSEHGSTVASEAYPVRSNASQRGVMPAASSARGAGGSTHMLGMSQRSRGSFFSGVNTPHSPALFIPAPAHATGPAHQRTWSGSEQALALTGRGAGNASRSSHPNMLSSSLRLATGSFNGAVSAEQPVFADYIAQQAVMQRRPTMNILVIGAPQVGKSTFINIYRLAVTNNMKWPTAPVGICGFYGTTTVEPYPNHPTEPTWLCIDTPGRFYDARDASVLEKLVEGMPWKTKLAGAKSLSIKEVDELTPIAANAAHQCVIVIPATDLVEDRGWASVLALRSRYAPATDSENVVMYTKGLVSQLRSLMNDAAPFVVVTKMDKVGGARCHAAKCAVVELMSQCVPPNRIYFCASSQENSFATVRRDLVLDSDSRESLVQLYEDMCFTVQWKKRIDEL